MTITRVTIYLYTCGVEHKKPRVAKAFVNTIDNLLSVLRMLSGCYHRFNQALSASPASRSNVTSGGLLIGEACSRNSTLRDSMIS